MNYVVLIKQVPDIKHIPRDAWDLETGTLRRALLENTCNEFDKQALALALRLREERPGKIVALTMGPPFAEEVLRYAMSVGADVGVLLTDRRLGGADTAATAHPLACAIRRIEKEFFDGDREYLIISGMQSVDGDTAQVPPQIAEEMGLPQIAYVTGREITSGGSLSFRRVTRGGAETVEILRYPCLLTVTEWTLPPYPTFARSRWTFQQSIHKWDADAIGAEKSRIGLEGSRTNVVKIFAPKEASLRRCRLVNDVAELVRLLKERYAAYGKGRSEAAGKDGYRLPPDKTPSYRGGIWVFAEQEDGRLHPAALELLGKARELADSLGEKVGAVLLGAEVDHLAHDLIAHGADKVLIAADEMLSRFTAIPYARALARMIDQESPQMLLFSATPLGRELAPRVAYATNSGLTADCTDLRLGDIKRGAREYVGILVQTRPALGGNIMATIISQGSKVQMSTARPGVLMACPPDPSRSGKIVHFSPRLDDAEPGVRILGVDKCGQPFSFSGAEIVVSGGLGCRTKGNFDDFMKSLATGFGNCFNAPAVVGASRQAVEAGFSERGRQIGQTGQTIAPNLYIAVGISGAVQHIIGVQQAGTIVAINKDPHAPIFRNCDFGVVGEIETVVPQLLQALAASYGREES